MIGTSAYAAAAKPHRVVRDDVERAVTCACSNSSVTPANVQEKVERKPGRDLAQRQVADVAHR